MREEEAHVFGHFSYGDLQTAVEKDHRVFTKKKKPDFLGQVCLGFGWYPKKS